MLYKTQQQVKNACSQLGADEGSVRYTSQATLTLIVYSAKRTKRVRVLDLKEEKRTCWQC